MPEVNGSLLQLWSDEDEFPETPFMWNAPHSSFEPYATI
jgi:hypothetical protein